jgi:putative MATE family efflux protein
MADLYMVSHLGTEAISAVGISRTITNVVVIAMIAVTTGAFTMVAQSIGAGDHVQASSTAKQSFALVGLVSVGLSAVGIAITPIALLFLSPDAQVANLGIPYLWVFFAGLIFMTLNYGIHSCLMGAGDTRTPLYLNLFISAVKLLVSYLLIYGVWGLPKLDIVGAAAGTVAGRIAGLIAGFWVLYSGRYKLTLLPGTSYWPEPDRARRILRIGIPSALQGVFHNSSGLVFLKLLALTQSGTAAVAAFAIGNNMEGILRRSSLSFGTSATTLVGQRIGSGDLAAAERYGWTTLVLGAISIALLGAPIALFAPQIIAVFTDDSLVIAIGVVYLYALVLAEPFMCCAITAGGSLRGAGDTRPALYYTIVAQWLLRLPISYLLAFTLGFDTNGLWAGLIIFSLAQGLLTVRKFKQGHWKTMKI